MNEQKAKIYIRFGPGLSWDYLCDADNEEHARRIRGYLDYNLDVKACIFSIDGSGDNIEEVIYFGNIYKGNNIEQRKHWQS